MNFALVCSWRQDIELRQASPHHIVVPGLVIVEANLVDAMAIIGQGKATSQCFERLQECQSYWNREDME